MPAATDYPDLKAVALAHGVSGAAVSGWKKKPSWPIAAGAPLNRALIDKFVADWVAPHRKGTARRPVPSPTAPVASASIPDVETASLEELEQAVRRAKTSEEAERLSKIVRALKVIREVRERDDDLMDAAQARAEVHTVFHFLQTSLMAIPRAVCGSCEGMTAAQIEAVLEGRITETLNELRRGLESAVGSEAKPTTMERNRGGTDPAKAVASEPVGGAVPSPEQAAEQ